MTVGAVILAAGSSSRMGTPKQLLTFGGQSLLRRAAVAALDARCSPVVVVTGAHAEVSRRELDGINERDGINVREAFNAEWATGMASSIRTGVEALLAADPDASAIVLALCDQPHVTAEVISELIARYRHTHAPLIASSYSETFGVPALFSRSLFRELASIEGAGGAKQLIEKHAANAEFVPFPGGAVDVDTPADFSRLEA